MTHLNSLRFWAPLAVLLSVLLARPAMAEEADLARSYNGTGLALLETLAGENGNVVISPIGIGSAMAMAATGARGETAEEMAEVLGYPVPAGELGTAARKLDAGLTKENDDAELSIANALHVIGGEDSVSGDYRDTVLETFGAEVFFGSDIEAINAWVKDKTNDRIDGLVEQIDPHAVAVLLNAVHLSAGWAVPFDERKTAPRPFHLTSARTVDVPTMTASGAFAVLRTDDFDAVSLPFKGDKLAMAVIVPKQADAPMPNAEAIRGVVADLAEAEPEMIGLGMPKFGFEFEADLVPALKELGLKLPFDDALADFAGIVPAEDDSPGLYISQVRHKAFIDVNEDGVEAAAGTAVELSVRSLSVGPKPFAVDRPFVFVIADKVSGAILFAGRVADPR